MFAGTLRSRRCFHGSLLAAVALVLALTAGVRAQPLADKVPADAMIYVGWLGTDTKGPGFEGSHLQAVLEAAQFKQLMEETLPKLLQKVADKDPNAAQAMEIAKPILMPLLKHPSAVWIGKPELAPNQQPKPHAGVLTQAGPDTDALLNHLNDLLKNAPQEVTDMVKVSKAGDTVVIAIGYGDKLDITPVGSITATPGYKAMQQHAVPNAAFFVYVDAEQLVTTGNQAVEMFAPQEIQKLWPKVRDAIGLAGVQHVVLSSGFDGKDWMDHAFVHAPAPRKGLLAVGDNQPLTDDALKTIPSTATMAAASKFDVSKLVSVLRQAVADVEPQATEQIDKVFAEASKAIKMDVQKDLIDTFGDEWVYYTDPMIGGRGMGGLVLINRLRDAKKGEQAFSRLESLINDELAKNIKEKDVTVKFLTTQSGGTTIHYLGAPLLSPAWAVKNGTLIVGMYPQIVAGAADQLGAGGKSILDNPDFQALRKRLGVTTATGVSFMDLPQTAPDGYSTWVAISRLSGFADMFGAPAPAMLLPPLNKLMPHLAPAGAVTWVDADGFHMKSLSPFPGATVLATDPLGSMQMSAPLLLSVMLPAMNKARDQANQVKSMSNLRQIGLAAFTYQAEKGKLPEKLSDLVDGNYLTREVLVRP